MSQSRAPRVSRHARLWAYLLAAALALAVLLEIALRVVLGLGSPPLFTPDAHYGYSVKENQHLRRFFVEIDTNAFGMRSDPVPARKAPGVYRILFVGDSVAYGTAYVDQKAIFIEQILTKLRSQGGRSYQVLNASAPGWAPSNEFEFLRQRGLYDADLVVMVYNTKDLTQPFAPFMGPPRYPQENPPTAVGEFWSRYLRRRLFHEPVLADPGSTQPLGPPSMQEAERVLATIEATRELVVSHGVRFEALLVPIVTPDVHENQAGWNQVIAHFEDWARQQSVPVLDLTPVLTTGNTDALYIDGVHLKQAGNDRVANAFLQWPDALPGAH